MEVRFVGSGDAFRRHRVDAGSGDGRAGHRPLRPRGRHLPARRALPPGYATLHEHLAELETGRLVLTHLGPDMLDHVDDVDQLVARDGLTRPV